MAIGPGPAAACPGPPAPWPVGACPATAPGPHRPPNADVGNCTSVPASNPLDRIDQLLRCTRDVRILQWLCERSGGFFIRNPESCHPHPSHLIPATNQVVQEFADLHAVIAAAASDNTITAAEARKIRSRWEQLKGATETFVRSCESGNFGDLPPKAATTE